MKQPAVYILGSKPRGVLYIGVTSNLRKRIWEHKHQYTESFTKKYKVYRLVYFEIFNDIENAIVREKRLKKWNRDWKIRLIESVNPEWSDLYDSIL